MKVSSISYPNYSLPKPKNNNSDFVNFGQGPIKNLALIGLKPYRNIVTPSTFKDFSFIPLNFIPKLADTVDANLNKVIPEGAIASGIYKVKNYFELSGLLEKGSEVKTEKFHSFPTARVRHSTVQASRLADISGNFSNTEIHAKSIVLNGDSIVRNSEIIAELEAREVGNKVHLLGGDLIVRGELTNSNVSADGHIHFDPSGNMKGGSIHSQDEICIWGHLDGVELSAPKIYLYPQAKLTNCEFNPNSKVISVNASTFTEKPKIAEKAAHKPPEKSAAQILKEQEREIRHTKNRASRRTNKTFLRGLVAAIDI